MYYDYVILISQLRDFGLGITIVRFWSLDISIVTIMSICHVLFLTSRIYMAHV